MNRKVKLALAALLGFSTACSSVKNTPVKGKEEAQMDTPAESPRIVVMYGVPTPEELKAIKPIIPDDTTAKKTKNIFPEVDPVVEKPVKN